MQRKPAESTVQVENARVRVTEWRLPPGSATGHHVHGYDYVIVPVLPGRLTMVDDKGERREAEMALGRSYFRQAGVSHDVINDGSSQVAFLEIELKEPPR